jgi:hypothetical protein
MTNDEGWSFPTKEEHEAAVASLNDRQREAFDYLKKWRSSGPVRGLREEVECGDRVMRWIVDQPTYGPGFVELMARLVGVNHSWLYARSVVTLWMWRSNGQDRLLSMRKAATGAALTWSDVNQVNALEDDAERWRLLEQTCAHSWTAQELARQVRACQRNAKKLRRQAAAGMPSSRSPAARTAHEESPGAAT